MARSLAAARLTSSRRLIRRLLVVGLAAGAWLGAVAPAAAMVSPEAACASGTWATCGGAVKSAIDALPQPLGREQVPRLVALAGLWSDAYEKRLRELEAAGRLHRSASDWTKIEAAVKEKVESQTDPVAIARDAAVNALLKKFLPRVAVFLEYAAPIGEGLAAFFNASEVASDFQEAELMNADLQQRIFHQLEILLRADWQSRLQAMASDVAPQLRRP